jgi:hypothetical protein
MSDTNDDEPPEWIEFPPDEEATVLTSISPECLQENCLKCPGTFHHPDAGDTLVFCVHICYKVGAASWVLRCIAFRWFFRRVCFEIAYNALKCTLICVVLLPVREVADVPCSSQAGCPRLIAFHDSIVDSDRKQHGLPFALCSFSKGRSGFLFNPRTVNRVVRKNDEQLVV